MNRFVGNNKKDVNVLILIKEGERYVFAYDDDQRPEAMRVLGRFACNPELSFTWYDAAVLSRRMREQAEKSDLSSDR